MFYLLAFFYLAVFNLVGASSFSDINLQGTQSLSLNANKLEFNENKIEVKRLKGERDSILIADFYSKKEDSKALTKDFLIKFKTLLDKKKNIYPLMQADIGIKDFPLKPSNFEELKENGIDYIITGTLDVVDESKIKIKVFIWDTYEKSGILAHEFETSVLFLDKFLAQFATQIYEFITGDFGFFYGKLLYTAKLTENGKMMHFKKVISSQEVEDKIQATAYTDAKNITFNPRYCKPSNEIMYVSQKRGRPSQIFILNRDTGEREALHIPELQKVFAGIFSPSFSSSCREILFSASFSGSTNIYSFNRDNFVLTKLTYDKKYINTSPSFFNGDKKIIFVSDRIGGRPKIFTMNVDGTDQKQITVDSGSYFSPSVSSDDKKIVAVKVYEAKFRLVTLDITGENEREILSGFLIENPVWTPIGKTILFSMKHKRTSSSRIFSASSNSREVVEMPALRGELEEPIWIDEF